MPDDHKIQCPTCHAMTLPAIKCPHCKRLYPVDAVFCCCRTCSAFVCQQCMFTVYGEKLRPTCHRCNAKKEKTNA